MNSLKLRQNKKVRDYFHASLAFLADRYSSHGIPVQLHKEVGINVPHNTVLYWLEGGTPYEELKIHAVNYLALLEKIREEDSRHSVQALKVPTHKMAESERSLIDILRYWKDNGETLDYIANTVDDSLTKSINTQNLSNWLAGKPPRKQKASKWFTKDADVANALKEAMGPERFARLLSYLDKQRVDNEAVIALKAKYAEETCLSDEVWNEISPLLTPPQPLMSADDLKKWLREMVEDWKSKHGSTN